MIIIGFEKSQADWNIKSVDLRRKWDRIYLFILWMEAYRCAQTLTVFRVVLGETLYDKQKRETKMKVEFEGAYFILA